jgi:hypothetical protein
MAGRGGGRWSADPAASSGHCPGGRCVARCPPGAHPLGWTWIPFAALERSPPPGPLRPVRTGRVHRATIGPGVCDALQARRRSTNPGMLAPRPARQNRTAVRRKGEIQVGGAGWGTDGTAPLRAAAVPEAGRRPPPMTGAEPQSR